MLIIYGTTFYGKRNQKSRTDTCRFCSQVRTISSFDGVKCFHIYGLPVIPMGRQKVLEMCSGCKRYLQLSMDKWNQLRAEELSSTRALYNQDQSNPESALALFYAYETYGTQEETSAFLSEITARFHSDAGILGRAAAWYRAHNQPDLALRFAEKSIAHGPSDSARRTLIAACVKKGDLNQALLHAQALESPLDQSDMLDLLNLTIALHKKGRSRDAYSLIQKIAELYPALAAAHYSVQREARKLEKELNITRSALGPAPSRKKDLIIGGSIAAATILALIGGNFYIQSHQSLIIANEYALPASVKVDEFPPMELKPGEAKAVTIAEGEHNVQTTLQGRSLAPRKIRIEDSVYNRFLDKATFVLNLGGAGVIVREEVLYTAHPLPESENKEPNFTMYTGQPLVALRGVHYAFVEPPKQLQLGKGETVKTQIHAHGLGLDPYQSISFLLDHTDKVPLEDALSHMEAHIEAGLTEGTYITIYRTIAQRNQLGPRAEEFLSKTLASR